MNVYLAGESVYELVSPEGDAFVMQSSNTPPGELAALGDRLTPAKGWQFRPCALDEEPTLTMDGKVKVATDDLSKHLQPGGEGPRAREEPPVTPKGPTS